MLEATEGVLAAGELERCRDDVLDERSVRLEAEAALPDERTLLPLDDEPSACRETAGGPALVVYVVFFGDR